jgi:hypothetical protein
MNEDVARTRRSSSLSSPLSLLCAPRLGAIFCVFVRTSLN